MPTSTTASGGGNRDAELVDALVQLSFTIQAVVGRAADRHRISLTQVRMLAILEDREIGVLELARFLELEKSSVSGLVDRAEGRGLVQRVAVAGRGRSVHVVVTPAARSLIGEIREAVRGEVAHLAAPLNARRRDQLHRAVGSVLRAHAERPGTPPRPRA